MRTPVFSLLSTLLIAAFSVNAANQSYTLNIGNTYLAPDGFYRSTTVANGQFPAPVLTANKGDTLQVVVNNQLSDSRMRRSTSIHWHGIFNRQNAWNDGPAFVTQCPIAPGNSFTYNVNIGDQAGTYWYHSHLSSQYVDGLRGPLIIYDPDDPHQDLYDVDDESTIITLADWYHGFAPDLQAQYLSPNNTYNTEETPDAGTINGVGRYVGGPATNRSVIDVQAGTRYRLRLINASAFGLFQFSIEGHSFTVIEADGVNMVPYPADYLQISPGQRYSLVITANQPVDNYWIRAPMLNGGNNPNLDPDNNFAILRYAGAPIAEPTTATGQASGTFMQELAIVPLENPGAPGLPVNGGVDTVFNLAFAVKTGNIAANTPLSWTVNGVAYDPPSVPTLLKVLSGGASTDSDFATGENTFVIGFNETVEINITGVDHPHPFHLHGHTFDIVRANGVSNYVNPPRRDVVTTGPGTTTIRFVADNPAPWILHCHIVWHLEGGLAVIFVEDPEGERSGPNELQPSLEWENLCPIYNALAPGLQ